MNDQEKTELEMFLFFEMTPDLVCIAGKDGYFKKVNRAVIEKLGYTEEELFAKPISFFIHEEDKQITKRKRADLLAGKALVNFENRYVTKQGNCIWLHWTSIYLPDKEVVFGIAKDVTEKKQIEKEIEENYLKFKGLANHFKTSLEKDRKYFAFELQADLAQLASIVKIDIEWLKDKLPDLPDYLDSRMKHASAISELLINTIRKISFSVSPDMLDDLGLDESLRWLCKEFTILTGIPSRFESKHKEKILTHEVQLDFFRICQEALNNVKNHAEAKSVKIIIEDMGDNVCLSIVDDGKGFLVEQKMKKSGLINMQERAASINAELIIQSEIVKGTRVSTRIKKHALKKNKSA